MYNSCTKLYLRFSLFYLLILFASFEKYIYISCRKLYLKFNSSILFDSFEKYIIPLFYLYLLNFFDSFEKNMIPVGNDEMKVESLWHESFSEGERHNTK